MIKTRIDYEGNGRVISVIRIKNTLHAKVYQTVNCTELLKADTNNPEEVWGIAEKIGDYLGDSSAIQPLFDELQQIGQAR